MASVSSCRVGLKSGFLVHCTDTVAAKKVALPKRVFAKRNGGTKRNSAKLGRGCVRAEAQSTETEGISTELAADLRARTQGSLIPETLKEMEGNLELQQTLRDIKEKGQKALTKEERAKRRRALEGLGLPDFNSKLKSSGLDLLKHSPTTILQINIGLYCNQACNHCHVESSPLRKEMMTRDTVDEVLRVLRNSKSVTMLDITGGAPELNEEFRYLVTEARKLGVEVLDRCNLTVLSEDGQEDLVEFLAANQVRVVASLPCYSSENVDLQRGKGVFEKSIRGLLDLNEAGYGKEGSGLFLDLVYNPGAGFLPPPQAKLQEAYESELKLMFGIVFNNLFTITNMPIKRFADFLVQKNELESYMKLLVDNFNPGAVGGVMCKDTISVRWDGALYDCDFNQQLEMDVAGPKKTLKDIDCVEDLTGNPIFADSHCFGCTAGAGSSCQGATA
mmetsp:Transcript_28506/g.47878  ORF Transcript_28506/g.47878 Transcript_28506/m.47878 type:complete len:447 (+) Transcript_28506:133-1473(+)|eukprot:CAMPEP_0198212778 /NCGR_PEP_ID=MMETSP1445-20131203/27614_1 /TAXON_ID=36898 /ORGANISM="Pyramimonas sp., Strain CCMP2087" /LENGTH=446 /DNA_ID=CAMNT_0043887311 /DNA_START=129 /DNA_END=1469 /DNA_ORIENTATION=-